jgi:hypothetical protein
LEAKQLVIQELLAERLTIRQAAMRFLELNLACPGYNWEQFRELYPGKSDEERHCRQALVFVSRYLDPEASRDLMARWRSELEDSTASF